jgi:hypothetical protein
VNSRLKFRGSAIAYTIGTGGKDFQRQIDLAEKKSPQSNTVLYGETLTITARAANNLGQTESARTRQVTAWIGHLSLYNCAGVIDFTVVFVLNTMLLHPASITEVRIIRTAFVVTNDSSTPFALPQFAIALHVICALATG